MTRGGSSGAVAEDRRAAAAVKGLPPSGPRRRVGVVLTLALAACSSEGRPPSVDPSPVSVEPAPAPVEAPESEMSQETPVQATVEAAPPPAPRLEHDLDRFRRETPRCREDVGHCFSLALHLVMLEAPDGRVPVQTIDWVAAQVRVAQELYAPIDASFQVDSVDALPGEIVEVNTRSERDALGHGRFSPGAAHVFVVARLGDIVNAGEEIRGVHWRDRADRSALGMSKGETSATSSPRPTRTSTEAFKSGSFKG